MHPLHRCQAFLPSPRIAHFAAGRLACARRLRGYLNTWARLMMCSQTQLSGQLWIASLRPRMRRLRRPLALQGHPSALAGLVHHIQYALGRAIPTPHGGLVAAPSAEDTTARPACRMRTTTMSSRRAHIIGETGLACSSVYGRFSKTIKKKQLWKDMVCNILLKHRHE